MSPTSTGHECIALLRKLLPNYVMIQTEIGKARKLETSPAASDAAHFPSLPWSRLPSKQCRYRRVQVPVVHDVECSAAAVLAAVAFLAGVILAGGEAALLVHVPEDANGLRLIQ